MTKDELHNNNLLKEEIKNTEKSIKDFEDEIKKDIEHLNNISSKNLDKLIKMIFDSCQEVTEVEYYIDKYKELMDKDYDKKEKLLYQREMTSKDVINANIYNIFGVYTATSLACSLFTSNPISFTQNYILLSAMQILAFKINLDYFTSNHYKNKIDKLVKQIDDSRIIDNYNLNALYKFHDMCIHKLELEVSKLYEIISKRKNIDVDTRINELLKGMNIEVILDNKNTLTKKKKR